MNIMHEVAAQDTEPPFKVEPENVTVTNSDTTIAVTLSGVSSQFQGFMLDSRQCDNCNPVGTFSLDDTENSQLICDSVVVHTNNVPKSSITVSWTPTETGQFFFRAAVVQDFSTFWLRKRIVLPSTTPLPSETSTHTRLTTSPTIFPTDSHATSLLTGTSTTPPTSEANSAQTNPTTSTTKLTSSNIDSQTTALLTGTSTTPPTSEANSAQTNPTTSTTKLTSSNIDSQTTVTSTSPSQCGQYMRGVLALLLFSRLSFLGGSSLLIIIRPVLKKTTTMSASVLELASKTVAVILVLIKAIKYECVYEFAGFRIVFTALTVAAMVSSLLHTVTVFLHCGPSHELRKCWLCAIVMVDLMNTTITTTAIFFGTSCFEERWLLILMGFYVAWEIMLYLGSVYCENMEKCQTRKKFRKNQNRILEKRISPWLIMFIIFTIINVTLTAALMTGVSLVRMIH
ncbi:hypothetical protein R3I94_014590 [Phoxinus phoxinus]